MLNRVRDIPITRDPDFTVDPKKLYAQRLVEPEFAVSHIKSGDRVAICRGREPQALGLAMAARRDELKGIRISCPQPGRDFGWYDDDSWADSFEVDVGIGQIPDFMPEKRHHGQARRLLALFHHLQDTVIRNGEADQRTHGRSVFVACPDRQLDNFAGHVRRLVRLHVDPD